MSTDNNDSKYVYIALGFGAFIIICSMIKNFKLLDFLYLISIAQVIIRYGLVCRKERRNR